jgi:hypothetical protein
MSLRALPVLLLLSLTIVGGENLVRNGSLNKGRDGQPAHWSPLDGLTAKWVEADQGHCLQFDTSVQQKDKKLLKETGKAPATRSQGNQYATVGAHEGCWAFCWPIDLSPDDRYFVLEVDVRGPKGEALVLLRGFQKITAEMAGQNESFFQVPHPGGSAYSEQFGPDDQRRTSREGDYLMVHRDTLHCRLDGSGKWQHFTRGIDLHRNPAYAKIQRLWLKPYAYWPLGIYEFDNLKLRRATAEEVEALGVKRKKPTSVK